MKKLLKGIAEFRSKRRAEYLNQLASVQERQSPDTLMIACSDSRVQPNVFASTHPGDLFVVRNVGNLVAPSDGVSGRSSADLSEVAAVEFAVEVLGVTDVIVCGHSRCGAMQALLEKQPGSTAASPTPGLPNLEEWLSNAQGTLESFHDKRGLSKLNLPNRPPVDLLSMINVLKQMDHIKTYSIVKKRLSVQKLRIHGWWYDLSSAEVYYFDEARGTYQVIDEKEVERLLKQMT